MVSDEHLINVSAELLDDCVILMIDVEGKVCSWNSRAESLLKFSQEQVIGRDWAMLFSADTRDAVVTVFERALETGGAEVRAQFGTSDGVRVPVLVRLAAVGTDQGHVENLVCVAKDLSGVEKTQQRLQDAELKFHLLMSGVQEYAIFMMDPEGRIIDWNSAAERLMGYTHEEVIGQPFSIFFTPEEGEPGGVAERELQLAIAVGRASDDRWHVRKDRTHFWANGITSALRDESGSLRGFAKVLRDNTERKRFEEELQAKARALQEADRRKDEFLAMLAHELRNPLAPVATALSLLQLSESLQEQDREAISVMDRQVTKLTRLINDLMDVTRITRGKLQLNRERIDLRDVLKSAAACVEPLVEEHQHTLTCTLSDEPLWVWGDSTRLEQVFENLLTNAAKYTETGGRIWLECDREESQTVVCVRDNGVGIAPELILHIFDLFTQADRSLDRAQGGLGIGLTIVRNIVQLHEGTVEVHTDGLGKGTEFVVRLPLHVNSAPQPLRPPTVSENNQRGTGKRVLVVDDNPDAAKMFAALLKNLGHEVETAFCSNKALDVASDWCPHVMLLDIGMPGLDGYQLAKRMREIEHCKQAVLVAITGYGSPEDRLRSKDAGFDYHLVKPVEAQELQAIL